MEKQVGRTAEARGCREGRNLTEKYYITVIYYSVLGDHIGATVGLVVQGEVAWISFGSARDFQLTAFMDINIDPF